MEITENIIQEFLDDFNNDSESTEKTVTPDTEIKQQEEPASEDPYDVPMIDVFEEAKNRIDRFDEEAYKMGTGYEAPSFPLWSEKMEGLGNGFYIFAGYPNSGKTAFAMNIADDYCRCKKNKLFAIYYSLDDSGNSLIARVLSMHRKIPIAVSAKPARYEQMISDADPSTEIYKKQLEERKKGLEELKEMSDKMMIVDSNDTDCIEKILNHAKMVKNYVQTRDPEANILVCIDSLMDINIDSENFRDEKEKNARISQLVKRFAERDLKCPIFGTAHVRKNSGKRVSIADLKESGRYEYDAKAVFLISNDVSRNGQNASIYYNSNAEDCEKRPILEIYWAKNKASSFKERTYCFFVPEYSYAKECGREQARDFDSKIYGE